MWSPKQLDSDGPRFLAILRALERDIADGKATAGDRLLPQRELAYRLGLSVGTVVRAYTVAEQRGLVVGKVGRGTFIAWPEHSDEGGFFGDGARPPGFATGAPIDLSLNVPPLGRQAEVLGAALRALGSSPELAELLRYSPHRGIVRHRTAVADWVARGTAGQFKPTPEQVVICNGAQHAMATVIASLATPGDVILTEALTYAGIKAIAGNARVSLHGVEMDADGLSPEALDAACERSGARLLYTIPTLHNPTGTTMPEARRQAIAAIARRRGLTIMEDDVYGFLMPDAPPPFAALLPEQTYYLGSFSKCLAPGLRVGFVIAPSHAVERIVAGIRATNWMTTPILVEAVARWIVDGTAELLAAEKRGEASVRCRIAKEIFGAWLSGNVDENTPAFHVWLRLPDALTTADIVARATALGIAVTPPEAVTVGSPAMHGIRICLGAAHGPAQLREGLGRLRGLFETSDQAPLPLPSVI
ncbi:DNA-binding transcriptional regulator, MocR family, contains an aminotransferase domain [Rhizobiales bacterium GAS113]|nr:DNA-binding transcriptional regulator, MocR family, contains an aminotransferase domain [Rhizobiales bacterium GAS113]